LNIAEPIFREKPAVFSGGISSFFCLWLNCIADAGHAFNCFADDKMLALQQGIAY
jgi:hypothetical protein